MDGIFRLSLRDRKAARHAYRYAPCSIVVRKALVLLLLDRGWSYRKIIDATFVSSSTIIALKHRYLEHGLDEALEQGRKDAVIPFWLIVVLRWLVSHTPQDFGFFRQRWSCEMLALLLREKNRIRLSAETIRRGLRRMDFVWRRPRPVLKLCDPEYDVKLQRTRRLVAQLPDDETAVFQDEVDVHQNPKIGSQWMVQGQQAESALSFAHCAAQ